MGPARFHCATLLHATTGILHRVHMGPEGHGAGNVSRPAPTIFHGLVAQWITRLTTDQKIPGSNPGELEEYFASSMGPGKSSRCLPEPKMSELQDKPSLLHSGANIDQIGEKLLALSFGADASVRGSFRRKCFSRAWFRSTDLWVMGPARFHCATLLSIPTASAGFNQPTTVLHHHICEG